MTWRHEKWEGNNRPAELIGKPDPQQQNEYHVFAEDEGQVEDVTVQIFAAIDKGDGYISVIEYLFGMKLDFERNTSFS